MVRTRSVGVNTCDVALATEPECPQAPAEPGTSVNEASCGRKPKTVSTACGFPVLLNLLLSTRADSCK